jgi:hypothetical protein
VLAAIIGLGWMVAVASEAPAPSARVVPFDEVYTLEPDGSERWRRVRRDSRTVAWVGGVTYGLGIGLGAANLGFIQNAPVGFTAAGATIAGPMIMSGAAMRNRRALFELGVPVRAEWGTFSWTMTAGSVACDAIGLGFVVFGSSSLGFLVAVPAFGFAGIGHVLRAAGVAGAALQIAEGDRAAKAAGLQAWAPTGRPRLSWALSPKLGPTGGALALEGRW